MAKSSNNDSNLAKVTPSGLKHPDTVELTPEEARLYSMELQLPIQFFELLQTAALANRYQDSQMLVVILNHWIRGETEDLEYLRKKTLELDARQATQGRVSHHFLAGVAK